MSFANEIADVDGLKKAFDGLDGSLNKNATDLLKLIKVYEDLNKATKDSAVTVENLSKAQKATSDASKQKDAIDKQIIATTEKLTAVENGSIKPLLEKKIALQAATKAQMDEIKAEGLAETSLVRMRQKLSELTKEYDKAGTRTKASADEINKLSREIGKAEEATNRHQRGVGGYADQLGKLPGLIGAAATATAGLGKQLWALVMNPIVATIAGIALVLGGLFKAFTSTDSGAVKFAGALKAVSNIADILMDRLWSTFKMLGSLAAFDWAGVKKNGQEAFGGIGKAIGDAAKAGGTYAEVMDDIDDREAASFSRTEKLRKEYVELSIASKNGALGSKEQSRLAELAISKEIEANGIELGFLKERTEAEKNNLATKINSNNLSTESKAKQIEEWLKLDDTQLNSAIKNNAEFAKFYNENEDEFKKLQKQKADEIGKESEANEKSRRMQTSLLAFKKDIIDQGAEDAKKATIKNISELETSSAKEKIIINKRHIDGLTSTEQYQAELLSEEMKFLDKKQALYKKDSKEWNEVETAKQDKQIKINDDLLKATKDKYDYENQLGAEANKLMQDRLDEQLTHDEKIKKEQADLTKRREDEEYKTKKESAKKLRDVQIEFANQAVNAIFTLNNQKLDKELDDLEKEKEAKLNNKNLTESQKAKIEADYEKKAAAIKTKQAKNDKLQALFDIAIGTAVGVASNLKTPLLIPWIISMGLLEAALVAAQPIPKYAKGTQSAERQGIFGEAGRELMFTRSGETILAEKPTYFEGDKFLGARIKSNPETERMMSMVSDRNIIVKNQHDDRLLNEMKSVKDAIINKPLLIMNNEYQVIGQGTSSHQQIIINRLLRNN